MYAAYVCTLGYSSLLGGSGRAKTRSGSNGSCKERKKEEEEAAAAAPTNNEAWLNKG